MSSSDPIITVDRISKRYGLGQIGAATLRDATERWWHRLRGRDPETEMGIVSPGAGSRGRGLPEPSPERPSYEGEIWALRDVSFEVRRGEVIGIIGRNGAGKSTLLKVLTRITEPSTGRAVLRGRVSSLLEVGTGFHPDLTGRENTYLNGAILGMRKKEIDRKFDEIVAFSEVEKFIDTPVKRYSSGMYVRLAFAVAAHLEPEILLVDEVLAVGDLGFQKKCLGRMAHVAREGRTVLFVSHNMAAIQGLCSRALLLQGGQLASDGPVERTVQTYMSSVQDLMDAQQLGERQDREGGDLFRFLDVQFFDTASRVPQNTLVSGQDVTIKVKYRGGAVQGMNDVVLSIAFLNATGGFLFACRSDAVGGSYRVPNGEACAVCRIPKLPLSNGRFIYNVIALRQETILDWVKEAGYVDVTAGDYYGTGKLPAAALQGVLVDYHWEKQ